MNDSSGVLVVNAGSSSLKFRLYSLNQTGLSGVLLGGQIERIGSNAAFSVTRHDGRGDFQQSLGDLGVDTVSGAAGFLANWLRSTQQITLRAVGHRVVHGGPQFDRPQVVTHDLLSTLDRYVPLAPLHQPCSLDVIRSIRRVNPDLLQVACFDTSFHRKHPPVADRYAIPDSFYEGGVRRYGFHGLSYEYIAHQLESVAPEYSRKKVIVAHLGSGASMCAMEGGRSVDSSMGFTALDGLPMRTRPGQLDPGVILYMVAQRRMSAEDIEQCLYQNSGLKALSGLSGDIRDLQNDGGSRASFATEYFVYHCALEIGRLTAALRGLDALVFTAGIGQHSATIRALIADRLDWLGVQLDHGANTAHRTKISGSNSRVALFAIPTDEEAVIAQHTMTLLQQR